MKAIVLFLILLMPSFAFDINKTVSLCAFDVHSKQLAMYDTNNFITIFDTKTQSIKSTNRYSSNKITSLVFDNGTIFVAFSDFSIAIFDENLVLREIINLDKIYKNLENMSIKNGYIYAIFDKNKLLQLSLKDKSIKSISKKFGKINAINFKNELVCVAGWYKNVYCYDEKLNLKEEFLHENIATSLYYCDTDNNIYLSDIDGNLINLNNKNSYKFKDEITQIVCAKDDTYVVSGDMIFKQTKNNVKEVAKIQNGVLAVYVDDGILIINKSGKIYKF